MSPHNITKANAPAFSSVAPPPPKKYEQRAEPSSLCEGMYDEASSAKSFQEALAEWRNGKNAPASKESATYAQKGTGRPHPTPPHMYVVIVVVVVLDSSSVTMSEVSTMAVGTLTQFDMGSTALGPEPRVSIEFTDKNKVTYFEKLLMKKYKDGTMATQPGGVIVDHPIPIEPHSEEEQADIPVISEYNVFYNSDDEDMVSDGSTRTDVDLVARSSSSKPGQSCVFIEELTSSISDEVVVAPKVSIDDNLNTSEVARKSATGAKHRSIEGSCKKKSKGKEKLVESSPSSLQQSDLLVSVKSAWAQSTLANHNSEKLGHFFLHGVNSKDDSTSLERSAAKTSDDKSDLSQFKLASTVWLPSSSTVLLQAEEVVCEDSIDTLPTNRPSTRERKDLYYDDAESDSEPENERDEFIQSRMGTTRDSCGEYSFSRPASTCPRDLEPEDQTERDRVDCEALDDLACELASTVECEGRLSRCGGDLEWGQEAATPVPTANEEDEEEDQMGAGEAVDLSKVISEFELYQRKLMEEDSDQEQ